MPRLPSLSLSLSFPLFSYSSPTQQHPASSLLSASRGTVPRSTNTTLFRRFSLVVEEQKENLSPIYRKLSHFRSQPINLCHDTASLSLSPFLDSQTLTNLPSAGVVVVAGSRVVELGTELTARPPPTIPTGLSARAESVLLC